MKQLLLLALALLVPACNDGDDSDPGRFFRLQVVVEVTGGASVSEVRYRGGNTGAVVVANPTLPFTATFLAFRGNQVILEATGDASTGTITARIQDDPAFVTSPDTYDQVACGPGAAACMLVAEHEF